LVLNDLSKLEKMYPNVKI